MPGVEKGAGLPDVPTVNLPRLVRAGLGIAH